MPDGKTCHLWIDLETTGLDIHHDAILEVAWTLTDEELTMLTPLRSRLTFLNVPEPKPLFSVAMGSDGRHRHSGDCLEECDEISPVVREMHVASGLFDDLSATTLLELITVASDIERFIFDDLASIEFRSGMDRLVLSGAGVSHFEADILPLHFPRLFGSSSLLCGSLAYWTHDTSITGRVLGKRPAPEMMPPSVLRVDCEMDGLDRLVHVFDDGRVMFEPEELVPHRAADDVVASLVDGRSFAYGATQSDHLTSR